MLDSGACTSSGVSNVGITWFPKSCLSAIGLKRSSLPRDNCPGQQLTFYRK